MTTTILVADDDIMCRFIIKNFLQPYNCIVYEFENGVTLLDWLQTETSEGSVALLLDLDMPVMDGFAFLKRWRELKSSLPKLKLSIIIVSASEFSVLKAQQVEDLVDGFIAKPIEANALVGTISRCLQNVLEKAQRF